MKEADSLKDARSMVERLRDSKLARFLTKYGQDEADDHAALIAFSALFSLFPLIGALLTLIGVLIRDPERRTQLVETISQLFPSQLTDLLGFLEETRQITGLLGVASFIGLLWTASNLFGSMAKAFNAFYGLEERGVIGQRLTAFTMIFLFMILIVVSVSASGAATFLLGLSAEFSPLALSGLGLLHSLIGWCVSLGSAFVLFLAIYRIVPNGPLKLRSVWRGAGLAALLFVLINQAFPLYLRFFGGGFEAYKTLGLFLLLMTWFYFLARILVLGCELNAFLDPLPIWARTRHAGDQALIWKPPPERRPRARSSGKLVGFALLAGFVALAARRLRRRRT
jgi:membrane protein